MIDLSPTRFLSLIGPGLLILGPTLSSAQAPGLTYWDVNLQNGTANGCGPHYDRINQAYEEVGALIDSALTDLGVIAGKRATGDLSSMSNYDRVAKFAEVIFGFKVDPNVGGMGNELFDRAQGLYQSMQNGVKKGQIPNPAGQSYRPALACGDSGWKFVGPKDNDPGLVGLTQTLSESRKGPNGNPRFPNGVWYWNQRYVKRPQSAGKFGICDPGVGSSTSPKINLITICDKFWKKNSSLAMEKSSVVANVTSLDDINNNVMSPTIVHEFAHYFGYPLPDQQAVDANGTLLWHGKGKEETTIKPSEDPKPVLTYRFDNTVNLAKYSLQENKNLSVNTASSYALFSLAAYLNNFDWSNNTAQEISVKLIPT